MPFSNMFELALNLLTNAGILFSIIFIYATFRFEEKRHYSYKIGIGIVLSLFVFLLMANPWKLDEGLYFDARTIMLSISGVFFGAIPTLIAAVIVAIYRIYLGGIGVVSGVLTIVISAFFGIYWKKFRKIIKFKNIYLEYYLMGLFVHGLVLLCFFATPYPQSIIIIKSTWISYIVVFPVATLLISIILDVQKEAIIQRHIIKNQQKLLQTSIDSTTTMEIYSVDQNLNYITFNNFHREQIKRFYNIDIKTGDSFLDNIEDDKMRIRLEKQFVRALNGETLKEINEVETKKGDFLEETFTPIEDENNSIFGVTVFSENITERYKQQQNIIHMSYHDALTGLKNRRFFQELIIKLDNINNYPLSIVFCDINGLKIINDTFGHLTGDETIKVTARELNKIFGKNNFYVSRIGGDEFAILMPKTTNAKARKLIDIAKSNIDNIKIKSINATVSFGLATKTNHQSLNDIIKYAENEMYAHKLSEASSQRSKIIDTIMNTLLAKNPREKIHSDRVADICVAIGSEMNMSSDDLKMLKIISNLHDIGKIAINDKILNKPGKLTNEEWDEIKRHPEIGYRILSSIPEYARIAEDILSHHENYDGKGYPRGLKGEEIPIRARIIALADAYDAMISDRPYRKGMSHLDAIKEIKRCRGMQFDPNVTDIFLKLYE